MLHTKKTSYSSNLKPNKLKRNIEDLFKNKNSNVLGQFTNQNEFKAFDNRPILAWYMPNEKIKSANVNGKIMETEKGSFLNLKIKPNSLLSLFAISSLIIGIIATIATTFFKGNPHLLTIGLVFIIVGIIYYSIGLFLRKRLQSIIENFLAIQKIR